MKRLSLRLSLLVYLIAFTVPISVPATRNVARVFITLFLLKLLFRGRSFDILDFKVLLLPVYRFFQSILSGVTFQFLALPSSLLPSLTYLMRKEDFNPKRALEFFLLGSFILSAAFTFQAFTGVNVKHFDLSHLRIYFPPVRPWRPSAFFSHPLTVGGILSAALLLSPVGLRRSLPRFIAILFFSVSIIVSYDRSYWISLLLSLLLIALFMKRWRKPLLSFLILLSLFSLFTPSIRERVRSIYEPRKVSDRLTYESNVCRLLMWKSAAQLFSDLPLKEKLFGISEVNLKEAVKPYMMNNYREFERENGYRFTEYRLFNHLHNNLIQIGLCYGFLGLLVFLYLFCFLLTFNYRVFRDYGDERFLMFMALYVNWFVAGFFEYNFGDEAVKFLIFLTVALNVKLFDKIAPSTDGGEA